jgi:CrcB protein
MGIACRNRRWRCVGLARAALPFDGMRAFLTTGILGGFTTFSAFSLDAALLIERADWWGAMFYMLGSVVLSVLALLGGLSLVRSFS